MATDPPYLPGAMGRRRKASLWSGTGVRIASGRRMPGYYARYSTYEAGRRVHHSKHFLSLNTARAWVRHHNARLDLSQAGMIVPTTLEEATEDYGAGGAAWSEGTSRQYAISLGLFGKCVGKDRLLHELGAADVDRFIAERSDGGRSQATVAKHLRSLNAFFEWAKGRHFMETNPVPGATSKPKRDIRRSRPAITEEILAALIGALEGDRRLAVAIAMTMGLDRGTIERLAPEQVNTDIWCVIFIRQKTGEQNAVPIPEVLIPEFRSRLAGRSHGTLLLSGLSRQRHEKDWWMEVRQKIGVPKMMFRDLRAVASTRLQQIGGATIRQAQDLMGHQSAVTTMGNYHIPDPDLQARMRQLPVPGFPEQPAPSKPKRGRGARPVSARRRAGRASKHA